MSPPMKIAIIEPVGGHGGMNYYDFGLARGLAGAGCEVQVFTCDETVVPNGLPFACNLTFSGIYGRDHFLIRAVRFFRDYIRALAKVKAWGGRIVHLHFFHCGLLESAMVNLAKLAGFKIVVTVHDVESFSGGHSSKRSSKVLTAVDALIAHNKVSKAELVSKIGVPSEKISVIPHGNYLDFSSGFPKKEDARRRLGIPSGVPVILFFGQIKEVKGLEIALEAISIVAKADVDFRFVIAGKVWKDSFERYQNLIDELGIQEKIIKHIRYIPDEEALSFYAAADLVVLPYKKIYQSGVLLMAMSLKLPVVVSDLPGMCEVVVNNENGFVFKSESAQCLADTLQGVLHDSSLRDRVAKQAFLDMEQQYSWASIGTRSRALFSELV